MLFTVWELTSQDSHFITTLLRRPNRRNLKVVMARVVMVRVVMAVAQA